jgi:hypothetical protein
VKGFRDAAGDREDRSPRKRWTANDVEAVN